MQIEDYFYQDEVVASIEKHWESFAEELKTSAKHQSIKLLQKHCQTDSWFNLLFWSEVVILFLGILANGSLLWLFLKVVKSQTASKVLGLNLAVMGLLYLSLLPLTLTYDSLDDNNRNATSEYEGVYSIYYAKEVFQMFNIIGCPLLLTCMCVERYLAVMQPVLYLRMKQRDYLVPGVVWLITLLFCMGAVFTDPTHLMVVTSIIIVALFVVMLSCVCLVVRSLQQQSPALNRSNSKSFIKKQALVNVSFVLLPTIVCYLPVVVMVPVLMYIFATGILNNSLCYIFQFGTLLPRYGVLVGPTFYLSKARQMCRFKGNLES